MPEQFWITADMAKHGVGLAVAPAAPMIGGIGKGHPADCRIRVRDHHGDFRTFLTVIAVPAGQIINVNVGRSRPTAADGGIRTAALRDAAATRAQRGLQLAPANQIPTDSMAPVRPGAGVETPQGSLPEQVVLAVVVGQAAGAAGMAAKL